MNKKLLQNCEVYFLNRKSQKHSCVMYANHIDFSLNEQDITYFHKDTTQMLDVAFNGGKSIVALIAKTGMGKSHVLRDYAIHCSPDFETVILTSFDKSRYVFPSDSKSLSDDYIIKKSICRIFMDKEFYTKRYSNNYFSKNSATKILYSLAKRKTLIIIDDFNLSYIPDFLYELADKGFKILISSRSAPRINKGNTDLVECVFLKSVQSHDITSFFGVNSNFTSAVGCNPLAAKFAKCYIDYHDISVAEMLDLLKSVSKHGGLSIKSDFIKAFWHLANFTDEENRLLREMCLLLFFIHPSTYISDKSSVFFSLEDACLYTGQGKNKFKKLISLGFINITHDGLLYMDNAVFDFVFEYMKPTAQNCSGLISFLRKHTDFKLLQLQKDLFAQPKCDDAEKCSSDIQLDEFLDLFAYFVHDGALDDHCLYNMIFIYILYNLGYNASHRYTSHLLLRNRDMLLHGVSSFLSKQQYGNIYDIDVSRKYLDRAYNPTVLAKLDIIRICISLLRFSHCEQYVEFDLIFDLLQDAFSHIISHGKKCSHRCLEVYYHVILICGETFFFFNDISSDGSYIPTRCCTDTCIGYTDCFEWNLTNAGSLYVLYSPKIFRLFASFHKITQLFLKEYVKCDEQTSSTFPKVQTDAAENFYREFSSFWHRLKNGFHTFYDFYNKNYTNTDVYSKISDISDDKLARLLNSASKIRHSGFDRASEKSADKYAMQIIDAVRNSKSPKIMLLLIIDRNFPISDRCIDVLISKNFFESVIVKNHERKLLSELYSKCANQIIYPSKRFDFYSAIMLKTSQCTQLFESSLTKGIECVCLALIIRVCEQLAGYLNPQYAKYSANMIFPLLNIDDILPLYKKATQNFAFSVCAEYCTAAAIIRLMNSKKLTAELSDDVLEALKSIVYERLPTEYDVSWTGFTVLISHLLSRTKAIELTNEILNLDLACRLSPKDVQDIQNYIKSRFSQ